MGATSTGARSIRKFQCTFLESISRSHPALPFIAWLPVALGMIYLGARQSISLPTLAARAAAGWLCWTLAEYALHRWVFHWEPRNARLNRLMRPIHKVHHELLEWDRVVAHPLFASPLALAFFGLFWLLLGMRVALPFFGGFTLGYLTYELIHFRTHYARASTRWARALRHNARGRDGILGLTRSGSTP